jgi:hypothetical protein
MDSLLQEIMHYRFVLRSDSCADPRERRELAERLDSGTQLRRFNRFAVRWPALFVEPHFRERVTVTNVGAGGLMVEPSLPLPEGPLEMVVVDAAHKCWRLTVRLAWRTERAVGLAFPRRGER